MYLYADELSQLILDTFTGNSSVSHTHTSHTHSDNTYANIAFTRPLNIHVTVYAQTGDLLRYITIRHLISRIKLEDFQSEFVIKLYIFFVIRHLWPLSFCEWLRFKKSTLKQTFYSPKISWLQRSCLQVIMDSI